MHGVCRISVSAAKAILVDGVLPSGSSGGSMQQSHGGSGSGSGSYGGSGISGMQQSQGSSGSGSYSNGSHANETSHHLSALKQLDVRAALFIASDEANNECSKLGESTCSGGAS